jgi:hypothetical protein
MDQRRQHFRRCVGIVTIRSCVNLVPVDVYLRALQGALDRWQ